MITKQQEQEYRERDYSAHRCEFISPEETGELAECPFCHEINSLRTEHYRLCYRVVCAATEGGCGASSGWAWSAEEAVSRWNNRRLPENLDPVIRAKVDEVYRKLKVELAKMLDEYYLVKMCDAQSIGEILAGQEAKS